MAKKEKLNRINQILVCALEDAFDACKSTEELELLHQAVFDKINTIVNTKINNKERHE